MDATYSQPFTRVSAEVLGRQRALVDENPLAKALIETVGDIVLVLNSSRQVVAHNGNLSSLGRGGRDIVGLVPGEFLECVHADEPLGCGSTEFCKQCGAHQALMTSRLGLADTQECRVSRRHTGALDLEVRTTPVVLGDHRFTVVCLKDIGDQKRRQVLERIFFHDVLNAAGGIEGLVSVLETEPGTDQHSVVTALATTARSLVDDIVAQRDLANAENHELEVHAQRVSCQDLVETLAVTCRALGVARDRFLMLSTPGPLGLDTDPTLLSRVLVNLVKNAFEATPPGGTVTLGYEPQGTEVVFWVHNPTEIPSPMKTQLFQRSFSTKGPGRGLGTYSVKLLSERYLRGRVGFTSSPQGTVFEVRLPAF